MFVYLWILFLMGLNREAKAGTSFGLELVTSRTTCGDFSRNRRCCKDSIQLQVKNPYAQIRSNIEGGFEIAHQDAQERIALVRLSLDTLENRLFQACRNVGIQLPGRLEIRTIRLRP